MSVAQLTNLPASVKQRLLNLSRQTQVEFNVLLTKYALERFLYRMSVSRSRLHFILKGALLFGVWSKELHRTTRDADFLSLQPPSLERLASDFRKICEVQAEPDGIRFLLGSVQAQEIRRQNIFGGIRITLRGVLGKANVPLQIDVGFGDACIPPAKIVSFPVLLDFPAPRLRAYARETMIAEKFHAAVDLGMISFTFHENSVLRGKICPKLLSRLSSDKKLRFPGGLPVGFRRILPSIRRKEPNGTIS